MYILYIYIYIIRVYTLEPPPSNRTHSVHVSEGLSITVSLVLQGIGGTGLNPHFFTAGLKSHWFTTCTDLINTFLGGWSSILWWKLPSISSKLWVIWVLGVYQVYHIYIYIYIYLRYIHICLPTWLTSTVHPDYMYAAAVMPPVVLFRLPRWEPKDASFASRRERPNPGFTGFSQHLEHQIGSGWFHSANGPPSNSCGLYI